MKTKLSVGPGRARVKRPERQQLEWRPVALDQCLPSDHRVRSVWAYVDSLDLSSLYAPIQAVEGSAGRDAVDPRILLALWMFATIEGVGSARQLARLCERDLAYMWICGGVGVNYHLLSDFRVGQGAFLDQLLTDTIATLMHQGLVKLEVVAQDGMRVRAHAGSSSFRRRKTLERCREEANEQVRKLREESEHQTDPNASNARREAARRRVARERRERIEKALDELAKLQEKRSKPAPEEDQKKAPRASTTDPEARKMKMADGGYRPAYNVQFATDGPTRMIVEVEVTNSGSDRGQMTPMHQEVCRDYGKTPDSYLVDCGSPPRRTSPPSNDEAARLWLPFMEKKGCGSEASIPMPASGAIPTKCSPFASGWRPSRPSCSISSGPPLRSFPTPSAATEVCINFAYEAWRKRRPSRSGTRLPLTSCECSS